MSCNYRKGDECAFVCQYLSKLDYGCCDNERECPYMIAAYEAYCEEEAEEEAKQAERRRKSDGSSGDSSRTVGTMLIDAMGGIGKAIELFAVAACLLVGLFYLGKYLLTEWGFLKSKVTVTITDTVSADLSEYGIRFGRLTGKYPEKDVWFSDGNVLEYKARKASYQIFTLRRDRASHYLTSLDYDGESDYTASYSAAQLDDGYVIIKVTDAEGQAITKPILGSSPGNVEFFPYGEGCLLARAIDTTGAVELTISCDGYQALTLTIDFEKTSYYLLNVKMERVP